jgi:hypothetical protein
MTESQRLVSTVHQNSTKIDYAGKLTGHLILARLKIGLITLSYGIRCRYT